MRTPVSLDEVQPAGELRRRSELNFQRLHGPEFQLPAMLTAFTAKEAPGDWVGRCLLALTLHGRVLRQVSPQVEEIVAGLPAALNRLGYIGEILPPGTADENQFGGHNALLRGLCEYYLWRRDDRARVIVRSILTHLMIPVGPLFAEYPDHALPELLDNQLVGLTVKQARGAWRGLSTDISTGFFTLDGLTQAYAIEPSPALRGLIETMIARYRQIDPVKLSAQTHSTLTALRGIFRWWQEVDPDPSLLTLVQERFAQYRALAETEHHANYNWFGRPDWTEPCAIVDAFLLAVQLWAATDEAALLEEAHRIFYNGLAHAQRPNGGYGCDLCTGANGLEVVTPHRFFEAPWCCSMRGAEGLARAAQYGWFVQDDTLTFAFYFSGRARVAIGGGELAWEQASEYPADGRLRLRVTQCTAVRPLNLQFFAPAWSPAEEFRVTQNGRPLDVRAARGYAIVAATLRTGDELTVSFPVRFARMPLQNPGRQPGHHRYAHGPWLLGQRAGDAAAVVRGNRFTPLGGGRYRCEPAGPELSPLPALIDLTEDDAKAQRTRIVFAD